MPTDPQSSTPDSTAQAEGQPVPPIDYQAIADQWNQQSAPADDTATAGTAPAETKPETGAAPTTGFSAHKLPGQELGAVPEGTAEGQTKQFGTDKDNPIHPGMLGRGLLNGVNNFVSNVRGLFGNKTAGETEEQKPIIPQDFIDRTFGREKSDLDRVVSGIGQFLPLVGAAAIPGGLVAEAAGAGAMAAGVSKATDPNGAAMVAAKISPEVARYVQGEAHDPTALALVKSSLGQTLTNLTLGALLKGLTSLHGAKVPAELEPTPGPVTATVAPHPDGFEVKVEPREDLKVNFPETWPTTPEPQLRTEGDLRAMDRRVAEGPFGGTEKRVAERRGVAQVAQQEVPPSIVVPTQAEAESVGASIEQGAKAHEVSENPVLTDEHKSGVVKLANYLGSKSNPDRDAVSSIITQHHLDEAIPYMAGPEQAGKIMDEIKETISRAAGERAMTGEQLMSSARDLLPGLADDPTKLGQAAAAMREAPQHMLAAKLYLKMHWQLTSNLARAADAAPGNAIAQSNLANALEHGLRIHNILEDMASSSGRALGTESPWGQRLVESGLPPEGTPKAASTPSQEGIDAYIRGVRHMPDNAPIDPKDYSALVRQTNLADGDPAMIYKAISNAQKATLARQLAIATPSKTIPFSAPEWGKAAKQFVPNWFVSNIISGVKTMQRVLIGGMANNVARPIELMWAGLSPTVAISEGLHGRGFRFAPELIGRGYNSAVYSAKYIGDAMTLAAKAFKAGSSELDPSFTASLRTPVAQGFSWLHSIGSVAPRFHMAEGEFNRAWAYMGEVASKSLQMSDQAGIRGAEAADRLDRDITFSMSPDNAAINKPALDEANEIANTRNIPDNSLVGKLTQWRNDNPSARLLAPIMRVPYSMWMYMSERLPGLNLFMKSVQDDFAAGGERARIAGARGEMGASVVAGLAALAHSRMVTGEGPRDPKIREEWSKNYQPYSIKIAGKWHSYLPLGGMAMVAKLGANISEGLSESPAIKSVQQEGEFEKLDPNHSQRSYLFSKIANAMTAAGHVATGDTTKFLATIVAAFAKGFGSQSWLHDTVENTSAMLHGDVAGIQKFIVNTTASMAVPHLVQDANFDATKREVDGVWSEIESRVPWLSKSLEPQRNGFGQPIMKTPVPEDMPNYNLNVFAGMKANSDPVAERMLQLGKHINIPHPVKPGAAEELKIDLRARDKWGPVGNHQSPWDRMGELVNSEQVRGGRTLYEAVQDRMETDMWQRWKHNDGLINPESKAVQDIQKIVSTYYKDAQRQVFREYPNLHDAVYGTRAVMKAVKSGNREAEDAAITKRLYGDK